MKEHELKKFISLAFLIVLGVFLAFALLTHINAFFGAFIYFILFDPVHRFMIKKWKFNRKVAALLVILLSIVIIIVPTALIIGASVKEAQQILRNGPVIQDQIDALDESFPQLNLPERYPKFLAQVRQWITGLLLSVFQNAANVIITLTTMYFLLHYLLVNDRKVRGKWITMMPFSKKNSITLLEEFKQITYSTILTSGAIALLQGGMLFVAFLILKTPGTYLWTVLAMVMSFLPVIGTPVIWLPITGYYLLQQNYIAAIGLFVWGLIVTTVDNFVRPYLQNKIGQIHPLITLIGIFVGVPFFGLVGIIIGPIILSFFLLTLKMFIEDHLKDF